MTDHSAGLEELPIEEELPQELLEKYAKAVGAYQDTVTELKEASLEDLEAVDFLLWKATKAKEALSRCQDRYTTYCAQNGRRE